MSSSAARSSCTQCLDRCRPAELTGFPTCHKHRLCKDCLAVSLARVPERRAKGVAADQCPVCDESRRRLGAKVRFDIWTEQRSAGRGHCRDCDGIASCALMKCGHSYCMPCLRKLPRSFQSRTVTGEMARQCRECEERGAEEAREEARASMERAADAARAERDEREMQEVFKDKKLKREPPSGSRRQAAPKATSAASADVAGGSSTAAAAPMKTKMPSKTKRQPTVPVGPSFLKTDAEPEMEYGVVARPKGKGLESKPNSSILADTSNRLKEKRRVSFDPHVRHRFISPRETKKRNSLPASASFSGSSRRQTQVYPPEGAAASMSEPKTPVEKFRSTHRGWGITTP